MCMHPTSTRFSLVILLGVVLTASGQQASPHKQIEALVDHHSAEYAQASKAIWEYAELGYHEEKSSALLQRHLQEAGFRVEPGVADEPTAFIATYGQGSPMIGILGEFDALPGLSQAAVPDRNPLAAAAPGHGCGHFGVGDMRAIPRQQKVHPMDGR